MGKTKYYSGQLTTEKFQEDDKCQVSYYLHIIGILFKITDSQL